MIDIDNHASGCISKDIDHFITALTPTPQSYLRGIREEPNVKGEGTLVWNIIDDQGRSHKINIKNYLYIPNLLSHLASPQYWDKQANDYYPSPNRTWWATYEKSYVL